MVMVNPDAMTPAQKNLMQWTVDEALTQIQEGSEWWLSVMLQDSFIDDQLQAVFAATASTIVVVEVGRPLKEAQAVYVKAMEEGKPVDKNLRDAIAFHYKEAVGIILQYGIATMS